jgi:hypothetical protein
MNENIRKLKGAKMDIDLAALQRNIAWEQGRRHRCAPVCGEERFALSLFSWRGIYGYAFVLLPPDNLLTGNNRH